MQQQAKKAYSGGMSQGSRKRLAKSITLMTQAIKPRWIFNPVTKLRDYHTFSFITLTVASNKNITARQAYDTLLGAFLDWMTKTIGDKNPLAKTYIWKAELQQRGQIHYHITTPAFIHHKEIRAKWNELQRKAGLLEDFASQYGHFKPPSTEIKKTRHIRKMDRYLIKELAKTVDAKKLYARRVVDSLVKAGEIPEEKRKDFEEEYTGGEYKTIGKIWGCSSNLLGVNYYTCEFTSAHERLIEQWVNEGKAWQKTEDFFSIIYCDNVDPPDLMSKKEQLQFAEHLKGITNKKEANHQEPEIPAACVDMEVLDVEQSYTWKQLEVAFF